LPTGKEMTKYSSNLFGQLRKNKTFGPTGKIEEAPYFQINFKAGYAQLLVVDKKGDSYRPNKDYFGDTQKRY